MEIYVFRHGVAADAKPGQDDAMRKLTLDGKRKLRQILALARDVGVRPDVVLSSPYRRALETAQMARGMLDLRPSIIETRILIPLERPEAVWEEIRSHQDAKQVMIVGHEPQLSSVVGYLIGAPGASVDLKKGAIARVDVDLAGPRPTGVLVWLLTAKLAGA